MNFKVALVSIGGIGTLSGIGVAGFWFAQPKNIGELLASTGKTLLDINGNNNEKEWKILYEKHKLEPVPPSESKIKKLLSESIGTNENEGINKLKKECEKLFKESISNNNNEFKDKKEKATNWCIKESQIIEKANKVVTNPSVSTGSGRLSASTTRTPDDSGNT